MSVSVTLKSYFYEVLIPSSQKNTSSPIEDILHHVSISFMKKLALYKCFNPRTHTGCDPLRSFTCKAASGFNPRTHTGCDLRIPYITTSSFRFQSTHPHGVRPPYSIHYDFLLPVSIHAPTRGATGRYLPSGNIQLSFNPRTHTRCDSAPPIPRYRKTGFNPRTHTRCDRVYRP